MEQKQYYDITEVCNMLGITSRTLRFYETKDIITSTTTGISSRRKYTEEQVSHIRNVLVDFQSSPSLNCKIKVEICETPSLKSALKSLRQSMRAYAR